MIKKIALAISSFVFSLNIFLSEGLSSALRYDDKVKTPSLSVIAALAPEEVSTAQSIRQLLPAEWPQNGILVFPDAGRTAWLKAIGSAKKSIQLAAYKLSDPLIIEKLIEVHKEKKIPINVLIQSTPYRHDKSLNVASPLSLLKEKGINVYEASGRGRFTQVHYKLIIIDERWAIVSSGNLDEESFDGVKDMSAAPCRDFAITITNPALVDDLSCVFKGDIAGIQIPSVHPQLIWGPDNQRETFLKMINSAKKSIRIYQQDFQDVELAQAVEKAARSGVEVEVIMMPYPFNKTEDKNIPNQERIRQAGGKVYLHKSHYIHAKLMIIDGELMYIGSCNFYPPSLNETRELGILTRNPEQIREVNTIFDKDKTL